MSDIKQARDLYDREFDIAFRTLLERNIQNISGLVEKYRRKLDELGVRVEENLPKSADDFYAEELKIEKKEV